MASLDYNYNTVATEEDLMGMMAGASLAAAEEKPTDAGDADGAQLAPAGAHATDKLIRPAHIDEAALLGRPRWRRTGTSIGAATTSRGGTASTSRP